MKQAHGKRDQTCGLQRQGGREEKELKEVVKNYKLQL